MLDRLRHHLGIVDARPDLRPADVMLVLFFGFLETRAREAQTFAQAATELVAQSAKGGDPVTAETRITAGTLGRAQALIDSCGKLIEQVKAKGPPYPTWDQAYRIERELVTLECGNRLHQTVKALLDRADGAKLEDAASLRKNYEAVLPRILTDAKPPGLIGASDAYLLPLALLALEQVQWQLTKTFKAVPLKRRAIHRLVAIEAVVFALFVFPYAFTDVRAVLGHTVAILDWSWFPLWIALTGGLLGAFFSRLWSLQTGLQAMTLEEVENAGDWSNIVLRGAVGMLGSLVVFFFLQSGIIDGSLFPNFGNIALIDVSTVATKPGVPAPTHLMSTVPSRDLAMMVIWSFLAGFSQKLVPDILAKTESQLNAATTPPAGRSAVSP